MSFRTQQLPNTIPVEGFTTKKLNSPRYIIPASVQNRCLAQIEKDKRFNTAMSLLESLSNAGYEAYLVGGCVRDMLRMKTPKDYDITTSATPEQTKAVFNDKQIIETGIKHGTVTVMMDNVGYEITTFRIDGDYSDGRHPDSVKFAKTIEEDLSRRDFTINAMAYNKERGFVDPYNGFWCLNAEKIVCVGNPVLRFQEDGLRILRAMRFACVFGYNIDEDTAYGMRVCKKKLECVSKERIRAELDKMISTYKFGDIMMKFSDILVEIIPELNNLTGNVSYTEEPSRFDLYTDVAHAFLDGENHRDRITSYALLFRDLTMFESEIRKHLTLGEIATAASAVAYNVMKDLKFDNETSKSVCRIIKQSFELVPKSKYEMRILVSKIGKEDTERMLDVMLAHGGIPACYCDSWEKCYDAMSIFYEIKDEDVFTVKDLDINGNDLMEIGFVGISIRKAMNHLLNLYFLDSIENKHDTLYAKASELFNLSGGSIL
jgi:tRNA nucleotidyltransferase (CCA-adding enzyme)